MESNLDLSTLLLRNFGQLLPEIILVVLACVIFLGGCFRAHRHLWAGVALLGVILAGVSWWLTASGATPTAEDARAALYTTPLRLDGLAWFVRLLTLAVGAVLILFSWEEVGDRQAGDYYGCLLVVLAGLSVAGMANELITLFVALELISIPTYVMLYLPKHDDAAQEAALKYFLLSIFSSAILLFGFSYLYGLAGSTNLSVILQTLREASQTPVLAQVAVVMVVAGLGFKITAVPFHFYAPDVYQGAPTVLAALLAIVPKVAGFAALLRVLGFVLPAELLEGPGAGSGLHPLGRILSDQTPILMWFLAAVTMFLGNMLALLQDNLKRLLAYSSVAHAGYMLIGLASAPYLAQTGIDGVQAVLFYLVAYGAMTVGAFAVLACLHSDARPYEKVDDLAGLGQTRPGLALVLTIFLFSLIGIPLTAGFTGKLLIFYGAIGVTLPSHVTLFRVLALLGVINAAIGGWYYLRLIAVMYLRNDTRNVLKPVRRPLSIPGLATILICLVLTVGLSVPPGSNWLLRLAGAATGQAVPVQQAAANPAMIGD